MDLAGVDDVAQVLTKTVGDEGDDALVAALCSWRELIEDVAKRVHDFEVDFFVVPADVVGLAHCAFSNHFVQCPRVIFGMQPKRIKGRVRHSLSSF